MPITNKVTTVTTKPPEPKVRSIGGSSANKIPLKRKLDDVDGKENAKLNTKSDKSMGMIKSERESQCGSGVTQNVIYFH